MIFGAVIFAMTGMQSGFVKTEFGEVALPKFASAPYPHISREQGYMGSTKTFPRDPHYVDSTVGVFIPTTFRAGKTVNFVVHFHGHGNHVAKVFSDYDLQRQMKESGLNAVLVVPQGPRDAADSGDGKLQFEPKGLENLLNETVEFLAKSGKISSETHIGKVALTAHSGGYLVVSAILGKNELADKISDVILFDATYGGLASIADWVKADRRHRLISICTDHLGHNNAQLIAMLQKRGVATRVVMENDATVLEIGKRGPLVVLTTTLEHNEVISKRDYFAKWLAKCAF